MNFLKGHTDTAYADIARGQYNIKDYLHKACDQGDIVSNLRSLEGKKSRIHRWYISGPIRNPDKTWEGQHSRC